MNLDVVFYKMPSFHRNANKDRNNNKDRNTTSNNNKKGSNNDFSLISFSLSAFNILSLFIAFGVLISMFWEEFLF